MGPGAGALNCPGLQAQIGSSDIATPTRDAVTECARILGDTAPLYSTDQTVADFDQLRQALGVPKLVVDGVSYGSFTAARYAIAHPGNVSKVVLDSVLPHHASASASLYLTGLTAEARVLRAACAVAPACGFDPAEDLAWVVRHRSTADGVKIFDAIVAYEFSDPTYRSPDAGDVIGALHAARSGSSGWLDQLVEGYTTEGDPPASFSSGLHAATLCADQRFPWGSSSTPVALRQPLLSLTARALPTSATWPYTTEVATQQGFIQRLPAVAGGARRLEPGDAAAERPGVAAERRPRPLDAVGVGARGGGASTAGQARDRPGRIAFDPEPRARPRRPGRGDQLPEVRLSKPPSRDFGVELRGIEPLTPALQRRCSTN